MEAFQECLPRITMDMQASAESSPSKVDEPLAPTGNAPAPFVVAESVGDHVVAFRWTHIDECHRGRRLADDHCRRTEQRKNDYERAVFALRARARPFGLVHDLRAIRSFDGLGSVADQLLKDAKAIARSGLVRRVAVVHAISNPLLALALQQIMHLSPVRPTKAFGRARAEEGIAWAAAFDKLHGLR